MLELPEAKAEPEADNVVGVRAGVRFVGVVVGVRAGVRFVGVVVGVRPPGRSAGSGLRLYTLRLCQFTILS